MDGVEVNWQDTKSFARGVGEEWLIDFQVHLRKLLPNSTIVHSPMAKHWQEGAYPKRGYMAVHEKVGSGVNFYNTIYYNQGEAHYQSYE